MIQGYTQAKEQKLCKKLGIDMPLLERWTREYKDEPQVKKIIKAISDLHTQVFDEQKLKDFEFDIPAVLTKEVYVSVMRKVLACVRHEFYNRVQELKAKGRGIIGPEQV